MQSQLCELLEWDSNFFGFRVGRIAANLIMRDQVPEILGWCQAQKVRCLYFLCACHDDLSVVLAEQNDFHLVDVRVELNWIPKNVYFESTSLPGTVVRPFCDADEKYLIQIAETAFLDTRFYTDTHFTRGQAAALYREWIRKSCHGFADQVLVAETEKKVSGFITCVKTSSDCGQIGLVAVGNDFRIHGIGSLLVRTAQEYFTCQNAVQVSVVSQLRNTSALNLYQKCDFNTKSVSLWYHKWFSDGRGANGALPDSV